MASKPTGHPRFWLHGLPLADLPLTGEAGEQQFWHRGTPTGILWTGLRAPVETRQTFPAGPRRETGSSRYWLNGLPFDMLTKGTTYDVGTQQFWLHGETHIGLFPATYPTYPFPPHTLAP